MVANGSAPQLQLVASQSPVSHLPPSARDAQAAGERRVEHSALSARHGPRRPRPARSSLQDLQRLVERIQALPQALPHAVCALLADTNTQPIYGSVPPIEVLRKETREHLNRIAQDIDSAMAETIRAAGEKWDQVDNRKFMHQTVRLRHRELLQAWGAIHTKGRRTGDLAMQAAATESATMLQTVFALVRLLETRMATIVRLRLRAIRDVSSRPTSELASALGTPEYPFLPIGAALREVASVW